MFTYNAATLGVNGLCSVTNNHPQKRMRLKFYTNMNKQHTETYSNKTIPQGMHSSKPSTGHHWPMESNYLSSHARILTNSNCVALAL